MEAVQKKGEPHEGKSISDSSKGVDTMRKDLHQATREVEARIREIDAS
jgi:hypothetical protein